MRVLVRIVLSLVLVMSAGTTASGQCTYWECTVNNQGGMCWEHFRQDCSQGCYKYAESCTALQDCPPQSFCGVWCTYSGWCLDI
jgi:hypothetical protein